METLNSEYRADGLDKAVVPAKPATVILDVPVCVPPAAPEPPKPEPLTPNEQIYLEHLESDIRKNLTSFVMAGRALAQIRDKQLYRQDYSTFQDYCTRKWQLGKSHAYRLIGESDIHRHLSPIGDKMPQPANEAQCRELVGLTPEQTVQAWTNAVTAAGGKPVTAKIVREAAAEFKTAKKAHKKSSNSRVAAGPSGTKYEASDFIFIRDISVPCRKPLLITNADIDTYLGALKKAYRGAVRKHHGIRLI